MNNLNLEDILADRKTDEDLIEMPLSDKVFRILLILIIAFALMVVTQLFHLGINNNDFYAKRAEANMSRTKVLPAPRGVILDRFGKTLVKNEPSFNVSVVPHELPSDLKLRNDLIAKLAGILGTSDAELNKKLSERDWVWSDRLLVAANISHDTLVALTSSGFSGVRIEPGFNRVHAMPKVFSPVVGYTGLVQKSDLVRDETLSFNDEVGRAGLEAWYDSSLRGKSGREVYYRNADGKTEEDRIASLPLEGSPLKTTIDSDLQIYFYERLQSALQELNRDVGVGIAMNPQNGEILALVGVPSYDALNIEAALKAPNQPLFNRVVSGLYNPGSTIKPLHAIAALKEGVISKSTRITSPGYIEIPNPYNPDKVSRFPDWKPNGSTNVKEALAKSSNVYFYAVGGGYRSQSGVGIKKLNEWWNKFLLSRKTGIDIPNENTGFLPTPEWKQESRDTPWLLGDTYNISIGQGDLLLTPISLLNYIGTIANKGIVYKPRLNISDTPVVLSDIRADIASVIDEVRGGMRDAVAADYGTAHALNLLPFPVSGKTGSAQVENNKKFNAFFVGYAPSDNPEIAILILIENAREGSMNVVPVAYDVLNWYYENRLVAK